MTAPAVGDIFKWDSSPCTYVVTEIKVQFDGQLGYEVFLIGPDASGYAGAFLQAEFREYPWQILA